MRLAAPAWLVALSWKLRVVFRPFCWWRSKHHGFWRQGYWHCRICAKQMFGAPPPGTLIADEPGRAIYETQANGSLRRIDKVRGGKKHRRRHRDEVRQLDALRKRLVEQGEQG